MTRCHQGGFGRNLGTTLLTSLLELPIKLIRDLRNNQKSINTCSFVSLTKNNNLEFWTWISISIPLKPVLGRNNQVDFGSAINTSSVCMLPHTLRLILLRWSYLLRLTSTCAPDDQPYHDASRQPKSPDEQTDRQTDRQIDRQTDRHKQDKMFRLAESCQS